MTSSASTDAIERRRRAAPQRHLEMSRRPKRAAELVATALLHGIDVLALHALVRARSDAPPTPINRSLSGGMSLVPSIRTHVHSAGRRDAVPRRGRTVDQRVDAVLVAAEVHRGPKVERRRVGAGRERIGDVHRVLAVRHQDPLFEPNVAPLVLPHRQPRLEPEARRLAPRRSDRLDRRRVFQLFSAPRRSPTRSSSPIWLSITVRPSGFGSAATRIP